MIEKSDVVMLLSELDVEDKQSIITSIYKSPTIPLNVLKLINDSKPLDVLKFYEKIRSSYNNKKSKVYINIMKADENTIEDPNKVLTTLSALLNQILQFKAEDKELFLKHSRAEEISRVIGIYVNTFNIDPAYRLLKLIKADVKCLNYIK